MTSFAESFTRGYTRGRQAQNSQREQDRADRAEVENQRRFETTRTDTLEQQRIENERAAREETTKLGEKKLATQILLAEKAAQEAGEGEIEQEFDIPDFDGKGGSKKVKLKFRGPTAKKREELELGEEFEGEEASMDVPEVGIEKGKRIKPLSTSAAVNVFEAKMRAAQQRARDAERLDPDDPDVQLAVRDAADRYAAGEITIDAARGLLGGVRGGLGPSLLKAVGDRRGVPPKVREALKDVDNTRAQFRILKSMAADVSSAKTIDEKIAASAALEDFSRSTASLLARGFGDNRISDADVDRVLKIAPGWKKANFAPEWIERELKYIDKLLDNTESNLATGYFREISKGGERKDPPIPEGFVEVK